MRGFSKGAVSPSVPTGCHQVGTVVEPLGVVHSLVAVVHVPAAKQGGQQGGEAFTFRVLE